MRGKPRISVLILATMLVAVLLPPTPAIASGYQTAAGDTTQLVDLLEGQLNLSADQAEQFATTLNPVGDDTSRFGRGGDASKPATISADDAPWTVPTAVGLNYVMWQDPDTLPDIGDGVTEGDGMVVGGTAGGPMLNQPYAVATVVLGDEIPMPGSVSGFRQPTTGSGDMVYSQWDFPLLIAGLAQWIALSQFPDDTWNLASFVMSLTYGPDPWRLAFYLFNGGQVLPQELNGFFLVYGAVIIIGVALTSALVPGFPPPTIGVRYAGDHRWGSGAGDAVITAPGVPLGQDSFWPSHPRTFVPGLPGEFDPTGVTPFVNKGDGTLWFRVNTATPWGGMPPAGYWSDYLQIGLFDGPDAPYPSRYIGFQTHAGESEVFGSGSDGPTDGASAFILSDGSILFGTPFEYDGNPFQISLDGGFQATEDGQFQYTSQVVTIQPEDVVPTDDPASHDGNHPVYDCTTGEELEPPPTVVEETTTTQPATTETSQPVASVTSTTTTTVPAATTGTRTRERFTPETTTDPCWWCWTILILFVAFLICVLYLWLKTYEWWTCWIFWFIVIFIWVPFLLAGVWWWVPAWWWVPLLAWFPVVGGYAWWWARRRTWWRPWYLYLVGAYLVALALGMILVGSPEWGLLFPLFWMPWVGFWFWYRARRRPWWQPWMWFLGLGYVVWTFYWVGWLTPWWAWWLPVVFFPFLGWWFVSHGYSWREIHGPKWCWILPFAFIPFFAWWIPLWGPWWCFVILLFFALSLLCVVFNHYKEEEWWTCWLPWFVVCWLWVPFLLAGLWFFRPNWWWWALLPWFVIVPWGAWWWARHRTWWRPWMWYWVGGHLVGAAVAMYVVGAPEWGLLFPVFWLPWAGLYLWYRAVRRPWWQPWMWGLAFIYFGWVVYWVGWLTPWWGWWFPVFFFPFLGWWYVDHGYEWELIHRKSCWLVPWCLLPWLGYMLAIYCIPEYYWGL